MRSSFDEQYHQPLRAMNAENQNLLDVGRAAGTGDDDELPLHRRIGHARAASDAHAAGRCSTNWPVRATTTHAGGR